MTGRGRTPVARRSARRQAPGRLTRAGYADSCGPRALGAVLALTRHEAAAALRAVGDALGDPPGRDSTALRTLLEACWALDARVVSFNPATGKRELGDQNLQAVHRRAARPGHGAPVDSRELPRGMRLAAWRTGPGARGRWLLVVHPPGRRQHVLALTGGAIVAGDPQGRYGPAELLACYKIHLEEEEPWRPSKS